MRIIAGAWRGRTLRAPPGEATRPTADRLRQALFDMLLHAPAVRACWAAAGLDGPGLAGLTVLDAFAGTGALGLEALSRGASAAWFIERDRAALAALRANVAACGAGPSQGACGVGAGQGAGGQATVLAADVLQPPPGTPCRLAFLDPPYGAGLLPLAVAALQAAGWLAPGAVLAVEAGAAELPALGRKLAERRHGAGRVTLWALD